jgi:hypothetical protein
MPTVSQRTKRRKPIFWIPRWLDTAVAGYRGDWIPRGLDTAGAGYRRGGPRAGRVCWWRGA